MRIYLVQHGDALPKEVDPERPLSEAGQRDVNRVAAFLADAGVRVARILHSGKRRAEETAQILGQRLGHGGAPAASAGLDPNDATDTIALKLADWSQATMLVGHLPYMAMLAGRLATGRDDPGVVAFTPGTVLCLERIGEGRFAIVWMIRPELAAPRPG